jgi:hypothetical protein
LSPKISLFLGENKVQKRGVFFVVEKQPATRHVHHPSTTFSPAKNHSQARIFSKTPLKNPSKTTKSQPQPRLIFFGKKGS